MDEPLPLLTKARVVNHMEEDFTRKAINKFIKNREVSLKLPSAATAGLHHVKDAHSERSDSEESAKNGNGRNSTPQLSTYEPQELKQVFGSWHLYKKLKFNYQPVRRYINLVAEDFAKNKILVSANLSNIFNTF